MHACLQLSKNHFAGFFDSFGSCLRAGVADFLRKIRRVEVFLTMITQITAKNESGSKAD